MEIDNIILFDKLSEFVRVMSKGRDESHGYEHMRVVCLRSLEILKQEYPNRTELLKYVMIVAWLHDVNDHKYLNDNTFDKSRKISDFLCELNLNDANLLSTVYGSERVATSINNNTLNVLGTFFVQDIIDRISYSREKFLGRDDWAGTLGAQGCIIRAIVSDADKLEALGKTGFDRCIEYTKSSYESENLEETPYDELVKQVKKHADEKLLKLKDNFIITRTGKLMAGPLHQELVSLLNKL